MKLFEENDTAETRLKKTAFIVEATSFEQHCLWAQHAVESPHYPKYPKVTWEQMHGWVIQVGKLGKRPVCISASWVKIDGFMVMFWYECSQVTDRLKSEAWIGKYFSGTWDNGSRLAECDAMNFHHCLDALREFKRLKSAA